MDELTQLKQHAREAIDGHKRAVAGLYIAGELPKYDEERMGEIRRHFDSERNRALGNIEARAKEIYQEHSRAAEIAGEFAPDAVLSASDRAAASERLALVEADVAGMDDRALAARLEGVLANGSKVEYLCYLQAARRRGREDEDRRASSPEATPMDRVAGANASAFDHVADRLEETLIGPERERRREQAAGRIEAAREVLELCYVGRRDAEDFFGAYSKQAYRQIVSTQGPASGAGGRIANDLVS